MFKVHSSNFRTGKKNWASLSLAARPAGANWRLTGLSFPKLRCLTQSSSTSSTLTGKTCPMPGVWDDKHWNWSLPFNLHWSHPIWIDLTQFEFTSPNRSADQYYVFLTKEAAAHRQGGLPNRIEQLNKIPGFFNLTMTYRRDSDIPTPYGQFVQRRNPPLGGRQLEEYIQKFGRENRHLAAKKGSQGLTIAQYVSNCKTAVGRENLVDMIDYITPVDIYGNCGDLFCPPWEKARCLNLLSEKYKFYLSFENAMCRDYITEKFFRVLRQNTIPVVFTGANMSAVAPPHSFINVADFPTIQALVKYLERWNIWKSPLVTTMCFFLQSGQRWCPFCQLLLVENLLFCCRWCRPASSILVAFQSNIYWPIPICILPIVSGVVYVICCGNETVRREVRWQTCTTFGWIKQIVPPWRLACHPEALQPLSI